MGVHPSYFEFAVILSCMECRYYTVLWVSLFVPAITWFIQFLLFNFGFNETLSTIHGYSFSFLEGVTVTIATMIYSSVHMNIGNPMTWFQINFNGDTVFKWQDSVVHAASCRKSNLICSKVQIYCHFARRYNLALYCLVAWKLT